MSLLVSSESEAPSRRSTRRCLPLEVIGAITAGCPAVKGHDPGRLRVTRYASALVTWARRVSNEREKTNQKLTSTRIVGASEYKTKSKTKLTAEGCQFEIHLLAGVMHSASIPLK